jgi:MYXO-CTERM domain-containing protein
MASLMLVGARGANPERDYTLVDPYTFGSLLRRSLGGTNDRRASFLDDTIPRVSTRGQAVAATVTVRNDGWDGWTAAGCHLGVVLGSADGATPAVPLGETVVTAPLPADVAPGASTTVDVSLTMPQGLGLAHLAYDVACGGSYFEAAGNIPYQDGVAIAASQPDASVESPSDGGGVAPADGSVVAVADGGVVAPADASAGAARDGSVHADAALGGHAAGGCSCTVGLATAPGSSGAWWLLGAAVVGFGRGLRRSRPGATSRRRRRVALRG